MTIRQSSMTEMVPITDEAAEKIREAFVEFEKVYRNLESTLHDLGVEIQHETQVRAGSINTIFDEKGQEYPTSKVPSIDTLGLPSIQNSPSNSFQNLDRTPYLLTRNVLDDMNASTALAQLETALDNYAATTMTMDHSIRVLDIVEKIYQHSYTTIACPNPHKTAVLRTSNTILIRQLLQILDDLQNSRYATVLSSLTDMHGFLSQDLTTSIRCGGMNAHMPVSVYFCRQVRKALADVKCDTNGRRHGRDRCCRKRDAGMSGVNIGGERKRKRMAGRQKREEEEVK